MAKIQRKAGERGAEQKNERSGRKDSNREHVRDNKGRDETKIREANKRKGTQKGVNMKSLIVEPHPKFKGVFIGRGKDDALLTLNATPGSSVYGEKRVIVSAMNKQSEYRAWNCYRSKLAAGIVCGLDNIYIKPGSSVLYLGAANGTTLSHVSEIIGPDALVYAVEFSQRSGRDLINLAMKRDNIIPIIADARTPQNYRMLVPMVDVIFSDVSQRDQSRIVIENASYFLKDNGGILVSIKASCVDSSVPADVVFANEVDWLKKNQFKPQEQVTLEPYEKNHAMIAGLYKASKARK
ncbi:rRNA 2'-O-methyltransferase fibrillarin [Pancytospora epiphaga]|nr:rRNA 2'-O-methyltransferase fibrillarin [Pancytospora epiphaga]